MHVEDRYLWHKLGLDQLQCVLTFAEGIAFSLTVFTFNEPV